MNHYQPDSGLARELAPLYLTIIFLVGTNDTNPIKLQSFIFYYVSKLQNTNVILTSVGKNHYLNKNKVNELLYHISILFKSTATYIRIPNGKNKLISCRLIFREILRLNYTQNYTDNLSIKKSYVDKVTQTDFITNSSEINQLFLASQHRIGSSSGPTM